MSVEHVEGDVSDVVKLRFVGTDDDGGSLSALPATQVAEVLTGLAEMASDFGKAGTFGRGMAPEILVRPPSEGSFVIEVVNWIAENPEAAAAIGGAVGAPSLSSVIWWATKSIRADVSDFEYLDNGNVKVSWQNDTVDEIPKAAWNELNKRKRRRRKQLRQIMAPLGDTNVTALQVSESDEVSVVDETVDALAGEAPAEFTLERLDYHLARPEDEVIEISEMITTEGRMSAIDFDNFQRWRVRTPTATRSVTVEDADFLLRVDRGLAIHKDDVFKLKIREDKVVKNGKTTRTWTVVDVRGPKERSRDVNDSQLASAPPSGPTAD